MGSLYIGNNNIARSGTKLYAGVGDVARQVEKVYAGDADGVARLIYRRTPPYTPPTYSHTMCDYSYSGSSFEDLGESVSDTYTISTADAIGARDHGYNYLRVDMWVYNRKGDQGSYFYEYCANNMYVEANVGSTYQPDGTFYSTTMTNPDGVYKSVTRYHSLSDIITAGGMVIRMVARDSSDNDLTLFTGGKLSVKFTANYTSQTT